jgi:hypothetical protein
MGEITMGRLEKFDLANAAGPLGGELVQADLSVKSLLTDAQNEELRLILSQPIEIATNEEMDEVFGNWGD